MFAIPPLRTLAAKYQAATPGGTLLNNLISSWELDEASGNAVDSHGSNNLTEDNGPIASATGPGGTGLSREFVAASSQRFSIASNSSLQMGDIDFTLEVWVYFNSLGSSEMDFISKFETSGNNREYRIRKATGNTISMGLSPDGSSTTEFGFNTGTLATGTWYHLVGWHDSVNDEVGRVVNGDTPNITAYSSGVNVSTSVFRIGALGRGAVTFFHNGRLAKARIWKRVLTSGEITQLYNSGNGLAYSSF